MSFTFDGTDFSTLGVTVLNTFELSGATSRPVRSVGLPAADRVWYERGESKPVAVKFPVRIAAASSAALQAALDDINAALSTDDDAELSYWYSDRVWLARWDGEALQLPVLNTCAFETTITFLAQPNMVAVDAEEDDATITTDPQTVWIPGPLEASGVVDGNAAVAPTLILENTGGDIAAGDLEIWNYATGAYIDYADAVPDTTFVKFDCDARRCYVSADGLTWTEVFGKVSTNWLTITGGSAAQLRVVGCAGGELSWSYRGKFL